MPTIFSHLALPIAVGHGLGGETIPPRLIVAGMVASVLPDLDLIAFRFGIAYSNEFGHRGFSHSLAFAIALGILAAAIAPSLNAKRFNALAFVTFCAASHGLLDMLTNGGLGVALFWPLTNERMFFPWRVIQVSPLSLRQFVGLKGWYVIGSELLWVWLPSAMIFVLLAIGTGKKKPDSR